MFIVRHRKIFFAFTIALTIFAIVAIFARGLHFGIDFTGGSILEVSYDNVRPEPDQIKEKLDTLSLGTYSLRPSGEKGYTLRTKEISSEVKNQVLKVFTIDAASPAKEDRFNSVGPAVGSELRSKAYVAIGITILCIVLFITFAFRKVSEPVQSWKYGLTTIVALVHDIIVSAGLFIAISYFTGSEIDLLFMSALLAILGYSVHDTIVVFDRVRESLHINKTTHRREDFEETVGKSVSQTLGRSINTSLTLVLVLIALYVLGGDTTKDFSLLLLLGVIAGTYSSICLAAPLLVTLEKFSKKKA